MSTSSSDRIFNVVADKVTVGLSGAISLTGMPSQSALLIKYVSGGSLEVGGLTNYAGATFSWGNGYLMGTSEALSLNCGGNVYLRATGATAICGVIRTITG